MVAQAIDHYCLKCGKLIGRYVPLTEEERDAYNVIQVCTDCYYEMNPHLRPKPGDWERMKARARDRKALL